MFVQNVYDFVSYVEDRNVSVILFPYKESQWGPMLSYTFGKT